MRPENGAEVSAIMPCHLASQPMMPCVLYPLSFALEPMAHTVEKGFALESDRCLVPEALEGRKSHSRRIIMSSQRFRSHP